MKFTQIVTFHRTAALLFLVQFFSAVLFLHSSIPHKMSKNGHSKFSKLQSRNDNQNYVLNILNITQLNNKSDGDQSTSLTSNKFCHLLDSDYTDMLIEDEREDAIAFTELEPDPFHEDPFGIISTPYVALKTIPKSNRMYKVLLAECDTINKPFEKELVWPSTVQRNDYSVVASDEQPHTQLIRDTRKKFTKLQNNKYKDNFTSEFYKPVENFTTDWQGTNRRA